MSTPSAQPFPWRRLLIALFIGLPALVVALVNALAFTSYFGQTFDIAVMEIGGQTFGTKQSDAPILLAIGTGFGAIGIFCARRLWTGVGDWRNSRYQ